LKIQVATERSRVTMLSLTNTYSSTCPANALEVTQQTNACDILSQSVRSSSRKYNGRGRKGCSVVSLSASRTTPPTRCFPLCPWSAPAWAGLGGEVAGCREWGRGPISPCLHHGKPGWVWGSSPTSHCSCSPGS